MNPDDGSYGYDDRPDRRRQKKSNTSTILLVVAGILVLVGAILIGKYVFPGEGDTNSAFAAPNFVGQTLDDAKKMAENSELLVKTTDEACENQPKGNICTQDPKAGVDVNKGDTVNLVVSTGAPKVTVPDVKGLTFEKAKSDLEDKGFAVEQKTEESDQTPGVVIDQDPGGDTEQEKGTTITLTVAEEKKQSTVPDVLGQDCDTAKARMTDNDLVGQCIDLETDDPNQVGKVIRTTPEAGDEIDPGSTVQMQVGKAKAQQTPVPNVTGQTVAVARQILQQAGFTNIQFAPGSDQGDNAVVSQQTPPGDTQVDNPGNTPIILTTNGGNNGNNGGFFGGTSG